MHKSQDRRIKPRILCDYPAFIEGYDRNGSKFKDLGRLVNLSACGLFMETKRALEKSQNISVTVFFSEMLSDLDIPKVILNGIVVRAVPQADGCCGIALIFNKYKFL
jgi:hypothetical protein